MKFHKKNISLQVIRENLSAPLEISCLCHGDWAYHREVDEDKRPEQLLWSVTHVPSGLVAQRYPMMKDARRVAISILENTKTKWNGIGFYPDSFRDEIVPLL